MLRRRPRPETYRCIGEALSTKFSAESLFTAFAGAATAQPSQLTPTAIFTLMMRRICTTHSFSEGGITKGKLESFSGLQVRPTGGSRTFRNAYTRPAPREGSCVVCHTAYQFLSVLPITHAKSTRLLLECLIPGNVQRRTSISSKAASQGL